MQLRGCFNPKNYVSTMWIPMDVNQMLGKVLLQDKSLDKWGSSIIKRHFRGVQLQIFYFCQTKYTYGLIYSNVEN